MSPRESGDPATQLAEQMLEVLKSKRTFNPEGYMPSVAELVETIDPQADEKLIKSALGKKSLKTTVLLAHKSDRTAPIALAGDLERLAASPQLIEFARASLGLTADDIAVVSDLKKQVTGTELRTAFAASLEQQIKAGRLANVS